MHGYCGDEAIVATHDVEALVERGLVVLGGGTFLGIVGYYHADVQQGQSQTVGFAHDANAPVDIGRVLVLRVILYVLGNVDSCIESLMANEHAVSE